MQLQHQLPGSDLLSLSKNQALLCQAVKSLYNIAATQAPAHSSTSARQMLRQIQIPQPLTDPTLTRHPRSISYLSLEPAPAAALVSPQSPRSPFPLPFPLRHLPGVMSAQPCLRITPCTQITPHRCFPPDGCHSDRRGNPILWSSWFGSTHCSSS